MKNDNIVSVFIGALRTNSGPIRIELSGATLEGIIINNPDKQLGFELSLAIQSYYRRKQK